MASQALYAYDVYHCSFRNRDTMFLPLNNSFGNTDAMFLSCLPGSIFLPPTTALGAGLYSVSIYGGLVLFGMFLLYDTQRIIKVAEMYPSYAAEPYDPVNM